MPRHEGWQARVEAGNRWLARSLPGLHRALRPGWRAVRPLLPFETYWQSRKDLTYYQEVVDLARRYAPSGGRVIDVGSGSTEVLVALDWFEHRVSLDLHEPLRRRRIERVCTDFMDYQSSEPFDLALCLQVLEHVDAPGAFAERLFAVARTVIVSVPYRWPAGLVEAHRHDPVDDEKLHRWMRREPVEARIVKNGHDRLVAVYRAGGAGRTPPASGG